MAAAEFVQKDANSITLNRHEIFYTFGGTFGRKDNIIFASRAIEFFMLLFLFQVV